MNTTGCSSAHQSPPVPPLLPLCSLAPASVPWVFLPGHVVGWKHWRVSWPGSRLQPKTGEELLWSSRGGWEARYPACPELPSRLGPSALRTTFTHTSTCFLPFPTWLPHPLLVFPGITSQVTFEPGNRIAGSASGGVQPRQALSQKNKQLIFIII